MARNRMSLEFDGLENMIRNLERAQVDVREATGKALIASKQRVVKELKLVTKKANYPAKGDYSTGDLAKSIDKNFNVEWTGLTATLKVGYDFSKSGLTSIMILYGTPRQRKSTKIYNAIFGARMKREIAEIQEETLQKIIERAVSTDRR